MSGQWSKSGWGLLNPKSSRAVSSGETEPAADPAAVPDVPAPAPATGLGEPATSDQATAAIVPSPATGSEQAAPDAGANGETAVPEPDGSEFLAKLARAMHTTAARERTRLADDSDRRRQAHVQAIRDRAASEVGRIRELAAEDMKSIEKWADGEAQRIKLEREQREKALNEDLELSLTEHGAKIDLEVKGAETAIAAYRASVDAFFEDLDRETDPVVIARQAVRYPAFPPLPETTRPAPTTTDGGDPAPAMVGVMGQAPAAGTLAPTPASIVASPGPSLTPGSDPGVVPADDRVPTDVAVGAGVSSGGEGDSPFQAALASRSAGWPRAETSDADRPDRQG